MNQKIKYPVLLVLLLTLFLALPSPASANPGEDGGGNGEVIFGGNYTLKSGQTLEGDLLIFGGQGKIEKDATVEGDVLIVGGTITVAGSIQGEMAAIGGTIQLLDSAIIGKDLNVIGTLEKSDKAIVKGNTVIGPEQGFKFDNFNGFTFNQPELPKAPALPQLPNLPEAPEVPEVPKAPFLTPGATGALELLGTVGKFFGNLLVWFALAGLAALIALFIPKPVEQVAKTITNAPILAGGMGLLTMIVAPALIILLVITIILSPVGLLGIMVLAIGLLFGWVAIGFEIGNRLAASFKGSWAPAVSAALGTLLLSVVTGLINYITCVGWMAGFIFCVIGLGGVVLSKYGTRIYSVSTQTPPMPPAPPPFNYPPAPPSAPEPPFMRIIEAQEAATPQNGTESNPAETILQPDNPEQPVPPESEKRKPRPPKVNESPAPDAP